ncbi:MAG TPA: hypothetical protein VI542_29390 [Candidatus Tectomicrobia bacterium]
MCQQRGLTVTELALQAGLSPAEGRALHGPLLVDPGLYALLRLARALGVSPQRLM